MSCFLLAPSHRCTCCGVAASSPAVRARARVGQSLGREGTRAGAQEHYNGYTAGGVLCLVRLWFPGACPCVPRAGDRAAQPAGGSRPGPGAWVAAGAEAEAAPCGCGARGGRGAVRAVQPAVGGGPESPT